MQCLGKFFQFVLFLLIGIACHTKNQDPQYSAEQFWKGARMGSVDMMRPYVTQESVSVLEENPPAREEARGEFILGEIKIVGERATIPTILNDKGFEIKVTTFLVKEKGEWKVDARQTISSLFSNLGGILKGMKP